MKCSKCGRYSRPLLRCLDGKVNPPTIKGTMGALGFGGTSYVCAIDEENAVKRQKALLKLQQTNKAR